MQRFAPNVTRGGIFLATRTPRPPGAEFAFEVLLSTGQIALAGEGKVIWVKAFNPAEPQKPHGMGVQFTHIDPATRETLNRILRSKAAGGAPGARARNGTGPSGILVDTTVDLAAEYGIDETALRRAVDHRRMISAPDAELEELLKPEPTEAPTLEQALAELPRLLDPAAAARRRSGAYRSLEITNTQQQEPERARPETSRPVVVDASGEIGDNGTGHDPAA